MAKRPRQAPRQATRQQPAPGGPRRLGGQQNTRQAPSASAQRRLQRKRQSSRSHRLGWSAVGLVLVAVLIIVLTNVLGGTSPQKGNDANGQNPPLAPASLVNLLTSVPASTFNAVGIDGQPEPFTVTKGQTVLTSGSLPRFVYFGAEYCPYCALMRWAVIVALGRFGTFHGLKLVSSANDDGDIPTFSFHKSTYTSPYLVFTPYEFEDRVNGQAFDPVPTDVDKLVTKYTVQPYIPSGEDPYGIPFLDIANRYVSTGVPNATYNQVPLLENGGPGRTAIAEGIRSPTSAVGKAIQAQLFVAQANYISAAVCDSDSMQPAAVCHSSGVLAAIKALASAKPVG